MSDPNPQSELAEHVEEKARMKEVLEGLLPDKNEAQVVIYTRKVREAISNLEEG